MNGEMKVMGWKQDSRKTRTTTGAKNKNAKKARRSGGRLSPPLAVLWLCWQDHAQPNIGGLVPGQRRLDQSI